MHSRFHPRILALVTVVLAAVGCGDLGPESKEERDVKNDLRLIGIALQQFQEQHGHLPYAGSNPAPAGEDDLDARRTHWRIALLPYLEQDNLYRSLFKRGQYWKDPSIQKSIIPVYAPLQPTTNPGLTHYQVFVGPNTAFPPDGVVQLSDITDGAANTILVVETEKPVNWARPEDLLYDPSRSLPKLGHPSRDGFFALMADGRDRYFPKDMDQAVLRALITRNGGETLPGSLPGK